MVMSEPLDVAPRTGCSVVATAPVVEERKYAMTRMRKGDYLLPSNSATTLWRIYTYEEDGSLERDDSPVLGTFWALARRPMPNLDATPDSDFIEWDGWDFWCGLMKTRAEALKEVARVG